MSKVLVCPSCARPSMVDEWTFEGTKFYGVRISKGQVEDFDNEEPIFISHMTCSRCFEIFELKDTERLEPFEPYKYLYDRVSVIDMV